MTRVADLTATLRGCPSLLIVCHDNPDPDTLASALALERIAVHCDLERIHVVYGGEISHQQNRAFVSMFGLELMPLADVDPEDWACIAFVDHAQPGANTSLPAEFEPDVVIDHHPHESVPGTFVDVRPEYGATATILVEYLQALDLECSARLASALLFAIHRERLDFVRSPSKREYEAALTLYEAADLDAIDRLYGSAFSSATIDAIGRAVQSREQRGGTVVAAVGPTTETDAMPQAADYLLNVEGVDTVLTYGVVGRAVRLSARSLDPGVDIGASLSTAFDDVGSAGGHLDMAGGHVDLAALPSLSVEGVDDDGNSLDARTLSEDALERIDRQVKARFFRALDLEDTEPGVADESSQLASEPPEDDVLGRIEEDA